MTAVRHLTVPDLAARRGVSVWTVYRWNTEGTGPKRTRQGKSGRVAYREADVEKWEAALEVGAARPVRALAAPAQDAAKAVA